MAPMLAVVLTFGAQPTQAAAQDPFSFIGNVFSNAGSLALTAHFTQLNGEGDLVDDGRCFLGDLCGAGAELLLDLPGFSGGDIGVELGLGVDFTRGFKAGSNNVDLRGSIRSLPTIAAYVSGLGESIDGFPNSLYPYFGLSFGLADLWNARAYDTSGLQFELDSQTFDWGLTAGLAVDLGLTAYLLTEATYVWRRFSSLEWSLPDAAQEILPPEFPRALELSGWRFKVGLQFQLKGEDEEGEG